jgi:hypothetical protein
MQDFELWIEAESRASGEWEPADDVTDAIVTLADGTCWMASFCSYAHVDTLRRRCAASGDCLGGRYQWIADLILIEDTSRATIEAVVRDLLASGALQSAFVQSEAHDAAPGD